mmetsp:Transcript_18548/g.45541  ORF Transcript_18548/g.45541 Transcript_18548/m.45541 type:complete len:103 (+) Transcript_18548:872-1180(+)
MLGISGAHEIAYHLPPLLEHLDLSGNHIGVAWHWGDEEEEDEDRVAIKQALRLYLITRAGALLGRRPRISQEGGPTHFSSCTEPSDSDVSGDEDESVDGEMP